ncbi:MAG: hypothetical protein ABWY13_09780 [Mesorhizobium sp.]
MAGVVAKEGAQVNPPTLLATAVNLMISSVDDSPPYRLLPVSEH